MASFNPKVAVHTPDYDHHDLSFNSLITSNFGSLKIVLAKHMFAGEKAKCSLEHLLKFQPLLAPVFQRYDVRFDSFVVPDNLQWPDALKFYKGGRDGMTDLPSVGVHPFYLYFYVACHQLFVRGISNNVLNPFSGSLIDDLNLPTFDKDLSEISSLSDALLVSASTTELGWSNSASLSLDNIVGFPARPSTAGSYTEAVTYSLYNLPFTVPNSSIRVNLIRNLFLCRLFNKTLTSSGGWSKSIFGYLHDAGKDITLLPFIGYQIVYREYYRNEFVDDNGTDALDSAPYFSDTIALDSSFISDFNSGTFFRMYLEGSTLPHQKDWIIPIANRTNQTTSFGYECYGVANGLLGVGYTYYAWATYSNWLKHLHSITNTIGKRDVNFVKDYFTSASTIAMASADVHIPVGSGFLFSNSPVSSSTNVTVPPGNSPAQAGSNNPVRLGDASLGTIPMLRQASVMQELQEKIALAGCKDYEWYHFIFGHRPSDARLHLPDFVGRFKSMTSISEITQTSESSSGKPLGDVAGKGNSYNSGFLFDVQIDEPSWVIVLMSVLPRQSYFQGLPREMCKNDRFDYLIPDFESVGMQAIDQTELYCGLDMLGSTSPFTDAFGFTDKYNEYRSSQDEIHGEFRNSMLYWTSSRMFSSLPALNEDFIRCRSYDEDLYRPFALTDGYSSHIIGELHFNLHMFRPLSLYPHYSL